MSRRDPDRDLLWLRARRADVLSCATKHGASNVRVFGSVARGEAGSASDVDLLVEMEAGRSLLDLVGLEQELEDLLGGRVHVVSDDGLSPHIRDRIHAEAILL
jgi:hypothetical protein